MRICEMFDRELFESLRLNKKLSLSFREFPAYFLSPLSHLTNCRLSFLTYLFRRLI